MAEPLKPIVMSRRRTPLSRLPLSRLGRRALERIRDYVRAYPALQAEFEAEKARNAVAIEQWQQAGVEAERRLREPIAEHERSLQELRARLTRLKLGLLDKVFRSESSVVEWRNERYRPEARQVVEALTRLESILRPHWERMNQARDEHRKAYPRCPKPPKPRFTVRDQLKTFTVDARFVDIDEIETAIGRRQVEEDAARIRREAVRAKASAYDERQRDHAKTTRNRLKKQLADLPKCPYCETSLDADRAHADHIYPIAHGGLSTEANMVFVCDDCNQSKRDLTLREFIKVRSLDEDRVHRTLERLGKRF